MTIENHNDPGDQSREARYPAGLNHLVSVYNRFAFKLFAEMIAGSEEGETIFFSPFSIATDLAMLYNSESDEIRRAVKRVLGYEERGRDELNQANAALKSLLEEKGDRLKAELRTGAELRTAVSNFCSRNEEMSEPEFEAIIRKFYDMDFEYLSDDPYGDTANINGWVSGKTRYLSAVLRDIHPDAACFLLNTLFFKRDWQWGAEFFRKQNNWFSFSPANKGESSFFAPMRPVSVPYYHGKEFQGVSFPFEDERKRIFFLLPEHLGNFPEHLTYENWKKWGPRFSPKIGEIHLPVLSIECETILENFLNIPDIHIWHRGFFKLSPLSPSASPNTADTEGTEPEFRLSFHRPFFCLIQDEESGMILFMGYIANPFQKACDTSDVCISETTELTEISADLNTDSAPPVYEPSEDADDLDLDVDDIIKAGGISVDSELPDEIPEELMSSIEAEIDNNLRELYDVYKNGETEPSDCIAGACTCIAIGKKKREEDETGLEEINLEGLELDLSTHPEAEMPEETRKDDPFTYLIKRHLLTPKDLKAATESRQPVEKYLSEQFTIPRKDILASFGAYYKVRTVEYERNITLDPGFAALAQTASGWVPLFKTNGRIVIATDEPDNEAIRSAVKAAFPNEKTEFRVAFREDIFKFVRHFRYIRAGRIFGGNHEEPEDVYDLTALKKELKIGLKEWELPVTRDLLQLVSQIVWDAYFQNVSDIYITLPSDARGVLVQGRIDGLCREYPFFIPRLFGYPMITCIKKMAGLNTEERGISQSGSIRLRTDEEHVSLRAVTYPTQEGTEDAVLSFFKSPELVPLHEMEFSKRDYQTVIEALVHPYGLILITGAESLGTLHALLNHLSRPEKKIFTAEHPLELIHPGIRQLRLNPEIGFDIPAALQTILQANPDVIGVSMERWDNQILQGSMEAALSGHLVLLNSDSFLNPSSVIARILDSESDLFAFTDSLLCLLSQHVIRMLCHSCKVSYLPTKREFDELVSFYGKEAFEAEPPGDRNGNPAMYSKDLLLYKAKPGGCPICFGTGYHGKMAVYEVLAGTREIKQHILSRAAPEQIQAQAIRDGMKTFLQEGIAKIFAGLTDWNQVRKAGGA